MNRALVVLRSLSLMSQFAFVLAAGALAWLSWSIWSAPTSFGSAAHAWGSLVSALISFLFSLTVIFVNWHRWHVSPRSPSDSVRALLVIASVFSAIPPAFLLPSLLGGEGQVLLGKPHKVGPALLTFNAQSSAIDVSGPFHGIAHKIEQLDAPPPIRFVRISSYGGNAGDAVLLASWLRARNAVLVAHRVCDSACGIAWVMSPMRAATPGTQVGFHMPYDFAFDGGYRTSPGVADFLRREFLAVGLTPIEVEAILGTGPDRMYYPDMSEWERRGIFTWHQD